MASDTAIQALYHRAMWDATPTGTDVRHRQLAVALGYPVGWRVVRSLEEQASSKRRKVIVDRIYAGDPESSCDMWFHHSAARRAAQQWLERLDNDEEPTCYDWNGGHLMPREARFAVGEKVSVYYEGDWYDAKILRRKAHAADGYRYQVYYHQDASKQSGVAEAHIRPRQAMDSNQAAVSLGFTKEWKAFSLTNNRWKIVAPDGTVFKSKKAALKAFRGGAENGNEDYVEESSGDSNKRKKGNAVDTNDPPWRKTGHEYLGKRVQWKIEHKITSRRTVTVEQLGVVSGWISADDVDEAGEPGFVSAATGKPAALFHVTFNDEPSLHPYGSVRITSVDLEDEELTPRFVSE